MFNLLKVIVTDYFSQDFFLLTNETLKLLQSWIFLDKEQIIPGMQF